MFYQKKDKKTVNESKSDNYNSNVNDSSQEINHSTIIL
jgi:hypothetical protein